jgi:lipooligosaccharide transport system permease protein
MLQWQPPKIRKDAIAIWQRNMLVWRKLIGPAMLMNFGEPTLYLLGLGYGLGFFIGEMANMPYLTFLASGIVASSAMTTASFEGMYSVYTRMATQKTYEAIMATPLEIDDILAGEMLWCATKSVISSISILIVAALLGVVANWNALWIVPVVFLIGLCFAGPAIMMAALASNYDFFNYYFVLAVTPMFMVCGVFYPVTTLPELLHNAVQFLPLTHAVALTRPLLSGQALSDVWLHLTVLGTYTVVSFYFAVVMVRRKLLV